MARQLILGTAGHIDHGKTALVRALTGVDTDRLPQEKARGITIDIGFAHLDLANLRLGIVDVPGHERFIKNMLAGASGVDVALLVVAADDSVMPQTREHLAILGLLGVERGLVAITKADLAEASWLDLVEEDVRSLVSGTFLEGAPIVRTSARTGAGLETLRDAIGEAAAGAPEPTLDEPFRLAIDRSFVAEGLGTVVTGTVWSGSVATGDTVELLPAGVRVRVRGIQSHGASVDRAIVGQRAALNLAGVHHTELARGDELSEPGLLRPATRIAARLRVLADSPLPVRHRARVRLHLGTGEVIASVRLLEDERLEPGDSGLVELACARPVVAIAGQPLVARAETPLVTIGGGTVLQMPSRVRRREIETLDLLRAMELSDARRRAGCAIAAFGGAPWDAASLWQACGLTSREAEDAIDALRAEGEILDVDPSRPPIHAATLGRLRRIVLLAVERLHESNPLEARIPRQRLAQELPFLDGALLEGVVGLFIASGTLEGDDSGVALPGKGPSLTPAQRRVREAWLAGCDGFSPPGPREIAATCGVSEAEARRVAGLCVGLGELVRVSPDVFLTTRAEAELRERVRAGAGGGLTVSQIKDLLGTSRKYAVPICEHLDRAGVTVRRGDVRVLA